jgi:transposase-like protein
VHLARNLGAKVRKPDQAEIMQEFMDLSRKKGAEEAISAYSSFVKKWGLLYPSVRKWSEEISPDEIFAFYGFPEGLRAKIYTNNCIEGFNKQIKRMIKKHIQFVDEKAEEKVLVSIFLHYDEKVGKRKTRGWEMIEATENKD